MDIKKGKVTRLNLYIRIIVGAYLLYLVYDIFSDKPEFTPVLIAGMILLFLAGSAVVIWSVVLLIKKDYYDPNEINDDKEPETADEQKEEIQIQEDPSEG